MHDELLTRSRVVCVLAGAAVRLCLRHTNNSPRHRTRGQTQATRRQPDSQADADPNDGHASHPRSTDPCCYNRVEQRQASSSTVGFGVWSLDALCTCVCMSGDLPPPGHWSWQPNPITLAWNSRPAVHLHRSCAAEPKPLVSSVSAISREWNCCSQHSSIKHKRCRWANAQSVGLDLKTNPSNLCGGNWFAEKVIFPRNRQASREPRCGRRCKSELPRLHPGAGGGTTCQIYTRLRRSASRDLLIRIVPKLRAPTIDPLRSTWKSETDAWVHGTWDPRLVNPASQRGHRTNRKQRLGGGGFRLGSGSFPLSLLRSTGTRHSAVVSSRIKQTQKTPQAGQVNTPPHATQPKPNEASFSSNWGRKNTVSELL